MRFEFTFNDNDVLVVTADRYQIQGSNVILEVKKEQAGRILRAGDEYQIKRVVSSYNLKHWQFEDNEQ